MSKILSASTRCCMATPPSLIRQGSDRRRPRDPGPYLILGIGGGSGLDVKLENPPDAPESAVALGRRGGAPPRDDLPDGLVVQVWDRQGVQPAKGLARGNDRSVQIRHGGRVLAG